MKAGQLVEFYYTGPLPILRADGDLPTHELMVKAGDIGMLISPASNPCDYATVLVNEQLVIVRGGAIRVFIENGFKEMLKRAGVSNERI